jgi:hypothetical protein
LRRSNLRRRSCHPSSFERSEICFRISRILSASSQALPSSHRRRVSMKLTRHRAPTSHSPGRRSRLCAFTGDSTGSGSFELCPRASACLQSRKTSARTFFFDRRLIAVPNGQAFFVANQPLVRRVNDRILLRFLNGRSVGMSWNPHGWLLSTVFVMVNLVDKFVSIYRRSTGLLYAFQER